jgi:hypothetical protein
MYATHDTGFASKQLSDFSLTMILSILFFINLIAYRFYFDHILVFILGFVFLTPVGLIVSPNSEENDPTVDIFIHLLILIIGAATLISIVVYGWLDFFDPYSNSDTKALSIQLALMIICSIRLKTIFEDR